MLRQGGSCCRLRCSPISSGISEGRSTMMFRSGGHRLAVALLLALLVWAGLVPSAVAAEVPHLTVTSLTAGEARLVGTGFPAGQLVVIRAQIGTCSADTSVDPADGTFTVRVVSTAACSGRTVI